MDDSNLDHEDSSVALPKRRAGNPNLAQAREMAMEAKRKNSVITKAKKLQLKQVKEQEYAKALEVLNPPTPVVDVVVPHRKKKKIIEISDSSSDEEESDSDESIEVVRVKRSKAPPPPKTKKKSKVTKRKVVSSEEDDDGETNRVLGGTVARDILRRRVLEKETTDAIRRLVPNFVGFK